MSLAPYGFRHVSHEFMVGGTCSLPAPLPAAVPAGEARRKFEDAAGLLRQPQPKMEVNLPPMVNTKEGKLLTVEVRAIRHPTARRAVAVVVAVFVVGVVVVVVVVDGGGGGGGGIVVVVVVVLFSHGREYAILLPAIPTMSCTPSVPPSLPLPLSLSLSLFLSLSLCPPPSLSLSLSLSVSPVSPGVKVFGSGVLSLLPEGDRGARVGHCSSGYVCG